MVYNFISKPSTLTTLSQKNIQFQNIQLTQNPTKLEQQTWPGLAAHSLGNAVLEPKNTYVVMQL